jgi:hypothetical protein
LEEKLFLDKSVKPTIEAMETGLGETYRYYEKINDLLPLYPKEWAFSKSSGWMCKYHDKKKALFYLIPFKSQFKISLTIREHEKEIMLKERSLSLSILDKIESAKKYSEGYAIQLYVTNGKDYSVFEDLIKKLISLR